MTTPYTPAGQAQNITPTVGAVGQGINQLQPFQQAATGTIPQLQTTEQNLYANPYANQFLSGSQTAGQMGQTAAQNQFGTGGQITQAGLNLIPGQQQILQTGFDPQQALYNRLLPQVQNAYNVANMQAGVGTTPYGAATTGQGVSDFMLNWQNQQLGREAQALGAAGGAAGAAGGAATAGSQLQAGAAPQYLQSAAYPYSTAETIGTGQNQAVQQMLANLTGGANIQNLPVQDQLSLLSALNQANQVYNTGQYGANQLQMQLLQGLGQGAGSLGGALLGWA